MDGDDDRELKLLRLSLDQRLGWVAAQKASGYACPVIDIQTGRTLIEGRPGNPKDGLVRH